MNRLGFVLLTIELGVGCASVSPERGHDKVSSIVSERTGHKTRWEKGPPDQTEIADWVRKVTAAGLTRDRAVEIALVNNPSLQATYEDLALILAWAGAFEHAHPAAKEEKTKDKSDAH